MNQQNDENRTDNNVYFILDGKPYTIKPLDRRQALKQIEQIMKRFNITKENIVADRDTLRWLFR